MKPNSRARNREYMWRKARHKQRLDNELSFAPYYFYDNLHQYSKNKINCSCPDCSPKTRNKGRRDRKNYNPAINYKHSDLIKQILMDIDEEEYSLDEEYSS